MYGDKSGVTFATDLLSMNTSISPASELTCRPEIESGLLTPKILAKSMFHLSQGDQIANSTSTTIVRVANKIFFIIM